MKAGWMTYVVVTVALAMAGSGCSATRASAKSGLSPGRDEIPRILERQVAAWNKGDLEGFMNGYWHSPALTFVSDGEVVHGWEPMLKHFRESYETRENMAKLTFSSLEITELGAETALVLGRWKLEGQQKLDGGAFSLVFRRIDGQWLIVHDHTSRDAP